MRATTYMAYIHDSSQTACWHYCVGSSTHAGAAFGFARVYLWRLFYKFALAEPGGKIATWHGTPCVGVFRAVTHLSSYVMRIAL